MRFFRSYFFAFASHKVGVKMDKLITVKDVKERYGCSLPTARKYIRLCNPHFENPLATFSWAFDDWEMSRLVTTTDTRKTRRVRTTTERVIVPRKRD